MTHDEIARLMKQYGVDEFEAFRELDTTKGNDYRLNVFIDKKYTLRINTNVVTEERLGEIDRLCARYRTAGVIAPRLYKNAHGKYITPYGENICYVSEYIDLPTEADMGNDVDRDEISRQVLRMIGRFSRMYTGVDLMNVNSMWSIIDLAPLDDGIDEKQENVNDLAAMLRDAGMDAIAAEAEACNLRHREELKRIYKRLPRCAIQGDLNEGNILIKDGKFAGLIDFNMAGTEVNVNHFCAETNMGINEDDFPIKSAAELYADAVAAQQSMLDEIFSEYTLNVNEEQAMVHYKALTMLSQYPNVVAFGRFLKQDANKTAELIHIIAAQ